MAGRRVARGAEQLALFAGYREPRPQADPAPYVRSETSRAAATAARGASRDMAWRILDWIKARGGQTCDEVETGMKLLHQSASAKIRWLVLEGHLVDSTRQRPTRCGRMAVVWVGTSPGLVAVPPCRPDQPAENQRARVDQQAEPLASGPSPPE